MIKDEILLFSGGTDSLIAWEYLNHPPTLFVNFQTRYSHIEWKKVKDLASRLHMDLTIDSTTNLRAYEFDDGSGFVPLRNTFLVLIAGLHANRIWLAGLGSDVVVDKNPDYTMKMSRFLTEQFNYRAKSVVVDSPFWNFTKEDTIRWLISKKGYDKARELILETFSCYSGEERPCGKCQACFRRYVALKIHGIEETYEIDPLKGCREIIVTKYIPQMLQSLTSVGKYDYRRSIETLGLLYETFLTHSLIFEAQDLIHSLLKKEKEKIVKQFGVEPNYSIKL